MNWQIIGNDPNDLKVIIGEDMLRVEQMDKKTFWYCVYHGDDTYDCWHSKVPRPKSLDEAKKQCEDLYAEILKLAVK